MLISHPYIKVHRKISDNVQHLIETEGQLTLYTDCIKSESDYFALNDVLDISFKFLSEDSGFLYLHTTRGVFSFHTKAIPHEFIDTYQNLKDIVTR